MGLFGGDKSDWLDAQATVLSEDPKGGTIGDTKHGRDYWKKNELELSLALPTGQVETVGWTGKVPQSICYSMQGRSFPVKVHPTKHDRLEIDWDAIVGWHQLRDVTGAPVGAPAAQPAVATEPIVTISGTPNVRINAGPTLTGDAALAELDRLGVHVESTSSGVKITRDGAETTAPDPVDKLEQLARLKEQGLLTDEQFELAKKQVLGET